MGQSGRSEISSGRRSGGRRGGNIFIGGKQQYGMHNDFNYGYMPNTPPAFAHSNRNSNGSLGGSNLGGRGNWGGACYL